MENKHKKRTEVCFRYVFTSVYPYGEVDDELYDSHHTILVRKLGHITHDKEAASISGPDGERNYVFKSQQKKGKAYEWDGSPMGESFLDVFLNPNDSSVSLDPDNQQYKYIPRSQSIMPNGYYSWWGISDPTNSPEPSPYGNNEFSGDLCDLLKCYRDSRHATDVYLLVGGTLRYIHEICCFIIVCTDEDRSSRFKAFKPPFPSSDTRDPEFDPNGLINATGKVISFDRTSTPEFKPKYRAKYQRWANLAFAFYFENNTQQLNCGKDVITLRTDIKHNESGCKCVKKRSPGSGPWVCPNEIEIDSDFW